MADTLFSPSWYRVSKLKPRLRGHTHIYRHDYRGEVWYVMQDHSKGRFYRFSPTAYHLIGQMDGRRSVQELWENTMEQFGDDAPTQTDVVQLMSQLHSSDVLVCDVPPDTEEILRRSEKQERARWKMNLRSPMALRFPLIDPEKFLVRTIRFARPFFSPLGAVIWLSVVVTAVILVGLHWSELTEDVVDRVLSAQNLFIIWLVYPVVKALHEFGHAYAVKTWGGEVHEMGIMLLVLMPIPYCDASAASEFRSKHRRLLVGAAGVMVELFLASIAVFVWLNLEPGILRSMAYNVILIGSVTTVLFNANPLLRFDGYYMFSDLIDSPNLGQRGMKYLGYLFKRYPLGVKDSVRPHTAPGEPFWFVVYSVSAFIYRMFVYTAIVLFIAGKFFFIGVLLALWAAFSMVVVPISKGVKFVASSPVLRDNRPRAILWTSGILVVAFLLLFVMPFPSWTRTEGVIWAPEESLVRAGTDGWVKRIVATPGTRVERDQVLIECEEPMLVASVKVLQARVAELKSRYDEARTHDPVQGQIVMEQLTNTRDQLEHAKDKVKDLTIRSPGDGVFLLPGDTDLPARFLRQGEPIAYVLNIQKPIIRVVVPQPKVDLVRQTTHEVEVRLVENISEVLPAVVRREVPEAEQQLPSTILGAAGGGDFVIDPTEGSGTKTFERLFQFDLELAESMEHVFIGGRAYVRFDHGTEPIAFQVYRRVRQMFLKRFNV